MAKPKTFTLYSHGMQLATKQTALHPAAQTPFMQGLLQSSAHTKTLTHPKRSEIKVTPLVMPDILLGQAGFAPA